MKARSKTHRLHPLIISSCRSNLIISCVFKGSHQMISLLSRVSPVLCLHFCLGLQSVLIAHPRRRCFGSLLTHAAPFLDTALVNIAQNHEIDFNTIFQLSCRLKLFFPVLFLSDSGFLVHFVCVPTSLAFSSIPLLGAFCSLLVGVTSGVQFNYFWPVSFYVFLAFLLWWLLKFKDGSHIH